MAWSTNPRYLIADATVPGTPETPCVAPPGDRTREFQEVLADYAKRKGTPRRLKRGPHHGGRILMRSTTPGSLHGPPLAAPCTRRV